mmetsp:Transcript_146293/g.364828  ORF Transcript_146293/g.364828 Transcript_146293/m.364828 type:complete len:225 (+) Transcript_146293:62-736(+)
MGAACTRDGSSLEQRESQWHPNVPVPVTLHVYDVGTGGGSTMLNRLLKPMGTGAFHCGVEVYGWEWSYSDIDHPLYQKGTGVFSCSPRNCEGHTYAQSIAMGKTSLCEPDVLKLIALLEKDWLVADYDLLTHNCCHFSDEFCQRIGVGGVPAWVTSLAGMGASLAATGDVTDITCCRMMVADSICCRPDSAGNANEEMVEAIPAISAGPMGEVLFHETEGLAER